jgi:DNA-binding beta-propeller fold protein YncE
MKNSIINIRIGTVLLLLSLSACHPVQWDDLPRLDPPCPCVQRISPTGAAFDELITVTGSNFELANLDQFSLQVGGSEVEILNILDENTLTFRVPKGATSGAVEVNRAGCKLEDLPCEADFTYYFTATATSVFAGIVGENSIFNSPRGIDIDAQGNLIVADRNHHVIQKINANGSAQVIAGVFNEGGFSNDPLGSLARFKSPRDVVVNPNNGDIYVADETNHSIRTIGAGSNRGVSTLSGDPTSPSHQDGSLENALFIRPVGIAISPDAEQVFVTEFSGNRLRQLNLTTAGGSVTTVLGTSDGAPSAIELTNPVGVAFSNQADTEFPVLVADRGNQKVRAVNINTRQLVNVPDVAGAVFPVPNDMESDDFGNIFVTEQGTNTVMAIFRDGTITTISGGGIGFSFGKPSGIAIDRTNNFLFVSDEALHVIIKIELE